MNSAEAPYPKLNNWVAEIAKLTTPDRIQWVTGSDSQWKEVTEGLVDTGTLIPLNPELKPNSFLCRSDPRDVARVEDRTFICSNREQDSGATNNWLDPAEMRVILRGLFTGAMRGRTMYVIPFVMGHLDAENPQFGVEITDSAYVVASMLIMARCGTEVLHRMAELRSDFVPAVHS
ncbi:MAG: phosphoenolpyruvate carboxykinase (GTP), partial [Angustibacter sp.]